MYLLMFFPTCVHRRVNVLKFYTIPSLHLIDDSNKEKTYGTLPVKLIPAKYFDAVIVSPNTGPSAGIKLTTPGGTPASLQILNMFQLDNIAVSLGFHKTALP